MAPQASLGTEMFMPALRELQRHGDAVVERAQELGLAILTRDGTPAEAYEDPEQRVPHDIGMALIQSAVHLTGDPAFALHAGAGAQRGDWGLYDLLSLSAPTLRESIQLASRFLPLLHDGARIELVEQDQLAMWRHQLLPGLDDSHLANEYVVAAFTFASLRALGIAGAHPIEVGFANPSPAHHAECERVFQCPVRYDCEFNFATLPSPVLDLPLVEHDAVMHAQLLRYAEERLARLKPPPRFSVRVRTMMGQRLTEGATLSMLADALHMSESTLQRRLQADGTTHSKLLDEVRRERASELLQRSELSMEEVAGRLGFAHRPAFYRAFKRWFQVPPREYRRRQLQRGSKLYAFYGRGEPTGD